MELWQSSAVELARAIRAKDLSARECVEAHLDRIAEINPTLNAIVTLVADRAMDRARRADEGFARGAAVGPLHGLPIAHKDLQPTAGIRTTLGSPLFKDFVPVEDSPLVKRLADAGAILVGKTNTPEFGAGSQTFNPVFGATLNPFDLTKTCGGSSGGAAVALASGMLPIADGTDMGGSLRNPAAFCGIVGLRPSPGLVPSATPPSWRSLSVDGPLGRTAADVWLLLGAMANVGDNVRPPLSRDFRGVRVAWSTTLGGMPVDRRVAAVVENQRGRFEALGCQVEDAEPDLSGAHEIFMTLRAHAFVTTHGAVVRQQPDLVKDTVRWEIARGEALTAADVARAESERIALNRRVERFMERYEFFVLPTTQVPPFDVTEPYVKEIDGVAMETYVDWMKSCYLISTLVNPAISVPCGFTADGLPVGLQIVGRPQGDWAVLQLADAFGQSTGERELLDALPFVRFRDEQVALRVHREVVGAVELPRPVAGVAERADNLE